MDERFTRTAMLIGEEPIERLSSKTVAVFGVGGVGGYVVEALARSGVGHFVLVDNDIFSITNLNRQILATTSTIGESKVEVAKHRILEINPLAVVETFAVFYLPETSASFDFSKYDYVVDAIDTVTAKLDIITRCFELGVPVISSMGTGNKLNPPLLQVSDLYETHEDPLARVMRRELKKRGVTHLKVVWSTERPLKSAGGRTPGSTAFVPSSAGLLIASEVFKDLIR